MSETPCDAGFLLFLFQTIGKKISVTICNTYDKIPIDDDEFNICMKQKILRSTFDKKQMKRMHFAGSISYANNKF